MAATATKRSRATLPGWSDLHIDLLLSIFKRVSTVEILRSGAVCTSWRLAAKTHFCTNSPPRTSLNRRLLLMLPVRTSDDDDDDEEGEDDHNPYSGFIDLAEHKFFIPKNMVRKCGKISKCIGSSWGWLLCLDEEGRFPYLFNPLLDLGIRPCFLYTLPFITKAALWGDPIHSGSNNYGIVVMYGSYFQSKLAFAKCGESKWTDLNGSHGPYCDIICSEDYSCVYALGDLGSVESWDLTASVPTKKLDLLPLFPPERLEFENQMGDCNLYSTNSYLVESQDDLLIVIRYIGNFVREDTGDVIDEEAILDFPNAGLVFPYRTKAFQVYKLNLVEKKWKVLESLGDRMLFLGGNQSLSLSAKHISTYKKNSIFFTDDSWDRMDEHYQYGGHDMGVYNLEYRRFSYGHLRRIQPPPFWLFPIECESNVSFEE